MLTNEDIQKIIKAQQEVFATKGDILTLKDELRKDFSNLQIAVDGYAKKADTYFQEMAAMKHRMDRHEKWFQEIAQKIGIKLEH